MDVTFTVGRACWIIKTYVETTGGISKNETQSKLDEAKYEVWLESFITGVATTQYEGLSFTAYVKMRACFAFEMF